MVIGEDRIFRAESRHDEWTRHTFASWYMMNGDDLYELAKIPGHSNINSNIKMTERYAKLARKHLAKTGSTP
jgi:site-specific recombinase XerD